ncbi:MAG: SpoIID/LytB domain-containing protein [Coleofasciculaceae cyanobacterium]
MIRLTDKHQSLIRSVLWPVSLVSVALFVPFVLAKTMPSQPQKVASSPTSPSLLPSPKLPQDTSLIERDWQHRLVSQGLLWQGVSKTASSTSVATTSQTKTTTKNKTSPGQNNSKIQVKPAKNNNKQKPAKAPTAVAQSQSQKAPANAPKLEIRVAISTGNSSLVVGSSTASEVIDAQGKVIGKISAKEGTNVVPEGQFIRIGKWQTAAGVWLKPATGGMVFVNDRWYRGDLLLVSQGDTLLAVNYVDLESYIASVVGAEVSPSWPMAALKAQAIAARSYAIVHYLRPAHDLYDLGNTERWQVYRGLDAEWNTTRQAVEETNGVFLSYKGGVVESMYAASDDIVTNVFGGVGMSQTGALKLAEQGYNYQQILGNYYPGTGLAWVNTKHSDID